MGDGERLSFCAGLSVSPTILQCTKSATGPTASDVAVQANVGFHVNCGSRWRVPEGRR